MKKIDLQLHSSYSDGVLSPEEVLKLCQESGLEVVSITDHDTVDHMETALELGSRLGIRVIVGTEFSVIHNGREFHLLAYNFNHQNQALKERMGYFQTVRIERAAEIVNRLRELGFRVTEEEVMAAAGQGTVGRPHLAQAVWLCKENRELLGRVGISTPDSFVGEYLITGKPAYISREKIEAREAIELVHVAGGVCVIAHPGWTWRHNFESFSEFLEELASLGLDGVETFFSTHDEEKTKVLHALAKKFDLYETVGSDFHNPTSQLFGQVGKWNDYGLTPNFFSFVTEGR